MKYLSSYLLLGVLRLALGWIFLWGFLDKVSGWAAGGSPTTGFLTNATQGPFQPLFQSLAGQAWVDWLFMLGLLLIGVALILGVGVKIAGWTGAIMMALMFLAVLPPEHNPILDEHVVYLLLLVGFTVSDAGDYLGFGKWWGSVPFVKKYAWLR